MRKLGNSLMGWGGFIRLSALFAMALQVVFFADHIGASAARALGAIDLDSRLGLLEICTGEGVSYINADGTPVDGAGDCPICDNAAMAGFGEPVAVPQPHFPVVAVAMLRFVPEATAIADERFPGEKQIRAPPVVA